MSSLIADQFTSVSRRTANIAAAAVPSEQSWRATLAFAVVALRPTVIANGRHDDAPVGRHVECEPSRVAAPIADQRTNGTADRAHEHRRRARARARLERLRHERLCSSAPRTWPSAPAARRLSKKAIGRSRSTDRPPSPFPPVRWRSATPSRSTCQHSVISRSVSTCRRMSPRRPSMSRASRPTTSRSPGISPALSRPDGTTTNSYYFLTGVDVRASE